MQHQPDQAGNRHRDRCCYRRCGWCGAYGRQYLGYGRRCRVKLNTEIVRILKLGEIAERFYQQGVEPVSSTPEDYAASIKNNLEKWGKLIKQKGLKAE